MNVHVFHDRNINVEVCYNLLALGARWGCIPYLSQQGAEEAAQQSKQIFRYLEKEELLRFKPRKPS